MLSRANRGAARQRDRRVARAAGQRDRRAAKKRDKLSECTYLVVSMPPLKSKVTYLVYLVELYGSLLKGEAAKTRPPETLNYS